MSTDHEKNILCFGDSNTWGADPKWGPRFDRKTRWPCILQKELGTGYHIIEEGLGGRTTVFEDPIEGDKSGLAQLTPILQSHKPLDLLIIMLGTNDLKNRFSASAMDISWGVNRLIKRTRDNSDAFTDGNANILVVCPPPFADMSTIDLNQIFIGAEEKSYQLAEHYQQICDEQRVPMLNAGAVIQSSLTDGIHLDASEHLKLGKTVAKLARNLVTPN